MFTRANLPQTCAYVQLLDEENDSLRSLSRPATNRDRELDCGIVSPIASGTTLRRYREH